MRRKQEDLAEMPCSIARTLAQLGDVWTLMVLREAFQGSKRFDDFVTNLGIATNILSRLLRQLSDDGILDKVEYSAHPPRYEYVLTRKGRDLLPALIMLAAWGDKYLSNDYPPKQWIHRACGHVGIPALVCSGCNEQINDDMYSVPTELMVAEKARLRRERDITRARARVKR